MVMMRSWPVVLVGQAQAVPRPTPGRGRPVGVLEASPLIGADEDQVAVTIDRRRRSPDKACFSWRTV